MSKSALPVDAGAPAEGFGGRLRATLTKIPLYFGTVRPTLRIPVFTWGTAYLLLWCYRTVFSVLGEVVVMRLTNIADTRSYQQQGIENMIDHLSTSASTSGLMAQALATAITKAVGAVIGVVTFNNPVAVNIGFQTIGFLGLLALLRAVDPRERMVLYALALLPSITVWSSIASKEALLFFFVGTVCAHIVKVYKNTERLSFMFFLCLAMVYVFKPHYMPALIMLLGITYVARRYEQKATLALLALGASFVAMYVARDKIDEFAIYVDWALLSMGGNSAREPFIVEQYDVFLKAPLGMYLSFTGPTLAETSKGVLHIMTFAESAFILGLLGFFLLKRLPTTPIYSFIVSMSGLFWILFPTYPPAVSNPGTAIRYRTGYILIVFICAVILPSRSLYIEWIRGWSRRVRQKAAKAAEVSPDEAPH